MIGLGLSDRSSSLVRAKVECYKSSNLFSCGVKDCSATRIPSSRNTGHHPWPTGSLVWRERVTPLQRCSWCILQPQPTGWNTILKCKTKKKKKRNCNRKIFTFFNSELLFIVSTNRVIILECKKKKNEQKLNKTIVYWLLKNWFF